jgi:adenosylmethionine-8-amino-7-oxononanoate aminotransferase
MKEVCEQYGALFIADEVMCGSGRTGTFHAWQQEEGFVPDIQTMGKAITGGYSPVGVVLANHKVCQTIEDGPGSFPHGFTYQGHPMTCAAGLEIIKIIQEDGLLEKVQEMGHLLEKGLKKHLGNHPHVGDIRGRGAFWAVSQPMLCSDEKRLNYLFSWNL